MLVLAVSTACGLCTLPRKRSHCYLLTPRAPLVPTLHAVCYVFFDDLRESVQVSAGASYRGLPSAASAVGGGCGLWQLQATGCGFQPRLRPCHMRRCLPSLKPVACELLPLPDCRTCSSTSWSRWCPAGCTPTAPPCFSHLPADCRTCSSTSWRRWCPRQRAHQCWCCRGHCAASKGSCCSATQVRNVGQLEVGAERSKTHWTARQRPELRSSKTLCGRQVSTPSTLTAYPPDARSPSVLSAAETGLAAVQLTSDFSVHKLSLDDVSEYTGPTDAWDE